MELNSILIAGCGYVGKKLSKAFQKKGFSPVALVRSEQSANELTEIGIQAYSCDLDQEHACLPRDLNFSLVYYLVPPQKTGKEDYRIRNFLSQVNITDRIILISTTGIYGNCNGEWVDESTSPNPVFDRALRRYDMENTLIHWCKKKQVEYTILRIPGIYGPGKLPLERIKERKPVLREEESPWSNRIHVDDLVEVCLGCTRDEARDEIFNVSDGHPSTMTGYFKRIAEVCGLEKPPEISMNEAKEKLSRNMMSYLSESRKISNNKMLDVLKVTLKYPTLEQGLAQCIRNDDD